MAYKDKDKQREANRQAKARQRAKNSPNYSETRGSNKSGYIYVIQHGSSNYYKIGHTANRPVGRLRDLQTGSPIELKLYEIFYVADIEQAERDAHRLVNDNWVRGEWFELDYADLDRLAMLLIHDAVHVFYNERDLYYADKTMLRCSKTIGDYNYGDIIPVRLDAKYNDRRTNQTG